MNNFIRRNKSTILMIAGSIGMMMSLGLAINATAKYKDIIYEKEKEGSAIDTADKVKVTLPLYIPVAILSVGSLSCIITGTILNKKQQDSMVSAYILLENSFKQYKNKVIELYGQETQKKVETEITNDKFDEKKIPENVLFYDEYSGEFFESTFDYIREAMYHVNRNFILRGYTDLNEVYDFLNLPHTDAGDSLGWSMDAGYAFYGYQWIDYYCEKIEKDDGVEYYILKFPFPPTVDALNDEIEFSAYAQNLQSI